MSSTKPIHGHEILRLLHAANPPLTMAGLVQEASRRFGTDAQFRTCSIQGMTLDQLIAFLSARGKVIQRNGCLYADISQMCNDDSPKAHGHEGES